MNENPEYLRELAEKLEKMLKTQDALNRDLNALKTEIHRLRASAAPGESSEITTPVLEKPLDVKPQQNNSVVERLPNQEIPRYVKPPQPPKIKQDLEKFIGENLINKIGILITVIGVAIGAKYSIDHQLISPLTRIILGYLTGVALLGFGIRLKKNYENYSSVLVSGAIAIMYFITYAAYAFYALFPQVMAFALMFLFTAFTVVAALNYNRQVIAHIGLVGAYAVPFLLSDGSGKVGVLFTYMAIINIGVMVIAFKKYWRLLYINAFVLTWVIYRSWYLFDFHFDKFGISFTFLLIFFITFYITFLVYKLAKSEVFSMEDIVLMVGNSFVFYALGYSILSRYDIGSQMLGVFTLGNAVIHFVVSVVLYKRKLADKNLFYLVAGMVLVFITIAVPVQLDGDWVTLLWTAEAVLLFWIGRTKAVSVYESLSYVLMILAFMSLLHGWIDGYSNQYLADPELRITPLLNIRFATSLLFASAFGYMSILNRKTLEGSTVFVHKDLLPLVSFGIPAMFLFVLHMAFSLEISAYFGQLEVDSGIIVSDQSFSYSTWDSDITYYKQVWLINYSLFFFTVLSFVNIKKLKIVPLAYINLLLNTLAIACFLTISLYGLSELRDNYLQQIEAEYYKRGVFGIVIRYISLLFVAAAMIANAIYVKQEYMHARLKKVFDMLLYTALVWICSSELIQWLTIAGSEHAYKLGLSILWGSFSLMMIAIGIWKHKKHLRIGAIALFAVTLLKLFFYDISSYNTIAKTILFVLLGVLLLVISFLYNKYKHIIFDEPSN
jgi:uncharacterized membrane protein